MIKQNLLAKTCIACGLQKPISAFLQISGPQGTSYGNICSTCRGSGMDKKVIIEQAEDSGSGTSIGLKIDSKAKVQIDRDKQALAEHKKELDLTEQEKQLATTEDKTERKEAKEDAEKKHRANYIEPKKTDSFFAKKVDTKVPLLHSLQEKQSTEHRTSVEHVAKKETQHKEAAVKQDAKDKGLDLSDIATDQLIGGKIKTTTGEYNRLKSWFGNAPMNTVERGRQFLNSQPAKNPTESPAKEGKDKLVDYVKENWEPTSPGSKRR
ncbi:MAG: hypothetical protein P4M14_01280 [Gammaproteobacteria bacterium]|nr:hypothetical protein [Gammaproteobacteria bacterium]